MEHRSLLPMFFIQGKFLMLKTINHTPEVKLFPEIRGKFLDNAKSNNQ